MQRNDLVFLALMIALAAVATAPPLPISTEPWIIVADAPTGRAAEMESLAMQISLAPVP